MQNIAKFGRNLMRYLSVQHIWNLSQQIYLETSSLKHANNAPKLPGVDNVVKNWALAMTLKALPLVNFWSIKLAIFYQLFVGEVCPKIPRKLANFSGNFSLKVLQNFTYFSRPMRTCIVWRDPSDLKISSIEVRINLEINWRCLCDLAHFLWWKQSKIMKCLF